jgi:hypothetical protein
VSILLILLDDCTPPEFVDGLLVADFRVRERHDQALGQLEARETGRCGIDSGDHLIGVMDYGLSAALDQILEGCSFPLIVFASVVPVAELVDGMERRDAPPFARGSAGRSLKNVEMDG